MACNHCLDQFVAVLSEKPGYELGEKAMKKHGCTILRKVVSVYEEHRGCIQMVPCMNVDMVKKACNKAINRIDKERPKMGRGRRRVQNGCKIPKRPEVQLDKFNVSVLERQLGPLPSAFVAGLPKAPERGEAQKQSVPRRAKAKLNPAPEQAFEFAPASSEEPQEVQWLQQSLQDPNSQSSGYMYAAAVSEVSPELQHLQQHLQGPNSSPFENPFQSLFTGNHSTEPTVLQSFQNPLQATQIPLTVNPADLLLNRDHTETPLAPEGQDVEQLERPSSPEWNLADYIDFDARFYGPQLDSGIVF